jgi:hypothetical protein
MKILIIFAGGIMTGVWIMKKYRDEILSLSKSLNTLGDPEVDEVIQDDNAGELKPETETPIV